MFRHIHIYMYLGFPCVNPKAFPMPLTTILQRKDIQVPANTMIHTCAEPETLVSYTWTAHMVSHWADWNEMKWRVVLDMVGSSSFTWTLHAGSQWNETGVGGCGGVGVEVTHEHHTSHTGRIPMSWNCEGLGFFDTVWSFSFTHHTLSHSHWDNPQEMGGVFWIKVGLPVSHIIHCLTHTGIIHRRWVGCSG